MTPLKNYPGNKAFEGAYQTIINNIPVHKKYYELFAGSAAIAFIKKASEVTVINDCNGSVIEKIKPAAVQLGMTVTTGNAIDIIKSILAGTTDIFVYMDPPYPINARRSQRPIYKYEMKDQEHVKLLELAVTAKFNCMISTYPNRMYSEILKGWRTVTFNCGVHGKGAVEVLYMNYESPKALHEYTYLGKDCWDRQRIKRKINRKVKSLLKLPVLERQAILQSILKL